MLLLSAAGIAAALALFGAYIHLKELEEHYCSHAPSESFNATAERLSGDLRQERRNALKDSLAAVKDEDWASGAGLERADEGFVAENESLKVLTHGSLYNRMVDGETCTKKYTAGYGFVPVILLMVYIFFFNLVRSPFSRKMIIDNVQMPQGFGAMIYITVAEILPARVRSVTNSLSVAFTCVLSFLVAYSYPVRNYP